MKKVIHTQWTDIRDKPAFDLWLASSVAFSTNSVKGHMITVQVAYVPAHVTRGYANVPLF